MHQFDWSQPAIDVSTESQPFWVDQFARTTPIGPVALVLWAFRLAGGSLARHPRHDGATTRLGLQQGGNALEDLQVVVVVFNSALSAFFFQVRGFQQAGGWF